MKPAPILPILLMAAGLALVPGAAKADCSAPTVSISSPTGGATFEGPTAEIDVDVVVTPQGFDAALSRVYVLVDNQEAASLDITAGGTYTLTIEAGAGMHELIAAAFDSCAGDGSSPAISITVTATGGASEDEAGGEGSGAATTSNDGDGTGGSNDDDSTTAPTCAVQGSPARSPGVPVALLLALLGIRRLRRART